MSNDGCKKKRGIPAMVREESRLSCWLSRARVLFGRSVMEQICSETEIFRTFVVYRDIPLPPPQLNSIAKVF